MFMSLLLLFALLQDGGSGIEFPQGQVQQEVAPAPRAIDTLYLDEFYLIQSDVPLLILSSPLGVVDVTASKKGTIVNSKFAGGSGKNEVRTVEREWGYLVNGMAAGAVELIVIPAGTTDLSTMRRALLQVQARKGQSASPDPQDEVDVAFLQYEREWREIQGRLIEKLRNGEIDTQEDAAKWFGAEHSAARMRAFQPLLEREQDAFGGAWTPEGHANYIRRYVRP